MTPWSISIKTVGGLEAEGKDKDFTVTVSPDDDMTSLHDKIEGVTGLKASQQRLIYRGRLLGGAAANSNEDSSDQNSSRKIGDVTGLCDGQTIHLVPKRSSEPSTPTTTPQGETASENSTEESTNGGTTISGTGTASLLAALLGLSADDDDDPTEESPSARRRGQRERLRTTRGSRGRRAANYRLTESDLVAPDPGPLEPVRQGLMTLHTMLPASELANSQANDTDSPLSPLDADRKWYRGQWIDCLDTVNQWLEATIVDIVRADDVLPPRAGGRNNREQPRPRSTTRAPTDPAVTANDFEGRRLLLLEPCEEDDSDEEEGELSGFRERHNNKGVQLLLVHYNGWPHRWDEWIRSDSERIRPFRTRTRHPNTAPHTSPSPQSVFHEAPATHIVDEDDDVDRQNLLPELSRVMTSVNDLLAETVSTATEGSSGENPISSSANASSHMPWLTTQTGEETREEADDYISVPNPTNNRRSSPQFTRQQLEVLAPLLDRLGRTLTDAAPHVANLAQNLPLDRTTETTEASADNETAAEQNSSSSGTGLFSLLHVHRDRRSTTSSNNADASTPLLADAGNAEEAEEEDQNSASPNPDHVDFVHGMVNTHRGESRGSRRGSSDDGAGLLGAYLAAASLSNLASGGGSDGDGNREETGGALGRILGRAAGGGGGGGTGRGGGGGGGGGIDIHIHAIVTGPGVGPPAGGLGLAMMGGGTGITTPTVDSSRNSRTGSSEQSENTQPATPDSLPPLTSDEDDSGIFSDLYSESPQPTNLHGSEDSGESNDASAGSGASSNEAPVSSISRTGLDHSRGTMAETRNASSHNSRGRSSSGSERRSASGSRRNSFRRGSSFGRILRRAMGGRRSSRSDNNRSTG